MSTDDNSGGAGPCGGPEPKCPALPAPESPPALIPPDPCPTKCVCKTPTPGDSDTCFKDALDKQKQLADQADAAKALLAELTALNEAAKAAKAAYTADVYTGFRTRWAALNTTILGAIDTAVCTIKCWWCLIECEVCPLLNQIALLEKQLDGDGTLMKDVHSLPDIQYWHQRNVAAKQARFDRYDAVKTAWADPKTTIGAALDANEALVGTLRSLDPVEALLQLVLKVIPVHLALAPADNRAEAQAAFADYLKICCCDTGEPEKCCGPDTGVLSALMRFAGAPLPYIVEPAAYLDVVCCVINERYLPAQQALAEAKTALTNITAQIDAAKLDLDARRVSVLKTALGNIVKPVDCSKYRPKQPTGDGTGDGSNCGCDHAPGGVDSNQTGL